MYPDSSKEIGCNSVNNSSIKNVSSPMKRDEEIINSVFESSKSNSGVVDVAINDFFPFLDSKTVKKIKETPVESRKRISADVSQIEYDAAGAKAILDSLG